MNLLPAIVLKDAYLVQDNIENVFEKREDFIVYINEKYRDFFKIRNTSSLYSLFLFYYKICSKIKRPFLCTRYNRKIVVEVAKKYSGYMFLEVGEKKGFLAVLETNINRTYVERLYLLQKNQGELVKCTPEEIDVEKVDINLLNFFIAYSLW